MIANLAGEQKVSGRVELMFTKLREAHLAPVFTLCLMGVVDQHVDLACAVDRFFERAHNRRLARLIQLDSDVVDPVVVGQLPGKSLGAALLTARHHNTRTSLSPERGQTRRQGARKHQ